MNLIIFSYKSSWYSTNRTAKALRGLDAKRPVVNQGQTSFNLKANSTTWVRASISGIFLVIAKSGAEVKKGGLLGTVCQAYSIKKTLIKALINVITLGHSNGKAKNHGDALFHLDYDKK